MAANYNVKYPIDKDTPKFNCHDMKGLIIKSYHSAREAQNDTGILEECIYNNLSGKTKKCRYNGSHVYFTYTRSETKPLTKHDKVKNWLNEGKSITPLDALKMFGLYRLSHVIYVLRKQGMKIKSEDVTVKGATFSKYSLIIQE